MNEVRIELGAYQDWIDSDPVLLELLNSIATSEITDREQALLILHKVCQVYGLRLMPNDTDHVTTKNAESADDHSVYEDLAILRYFFPDHPPQGLAMQALYNVRNQQYIPSDVVAYHHFDVEEIPDGLMVFFTGELPEPTVSFNPPMENNDWTTSKALIVHHLVKGM